MDWEGLTNAADAIINMQSKLVSVCRYTGFGAAGKWEPTSQNACPNFREDLQTYLSTAGSASKTLLVSAFAPVEIVAGSILLFGYCGHCCLAGAASRWQNHGC